MNRRTLLASILALPLSTLPASAALHNHTWYVVPNKLGINVSYSSAMAADLWTIYGIDIKKIIPHMQGTEFNVSLRKLKKWKTLFPVFKTNNVLDGEHFITNFTMSKTDELIQRLKFTHKWDPVLKNISTKRGAVVG